MNLVSQSSNYITYIFTNLSNFKSKPTKPHTDTLELRKKIQLLKNKYADVDCCFVVFPSSFYI